MTRDVRVEDSFLPELIGRRFVNVPRRKMQVCQDLERLDLTFHSQIKLAMIPK